MYVILDDVFRTIKTKWCVAMVIIVFAVVEVASLNGANVCMVKQKYNITKRVKYRAPMSVRTYEWCFSMPPRCSRWNTEMRDLTRLETEERIAEVAVCCPGYKMQEVSCVPICPNGKTGPDCSEGCPLNKWGPNCALDCKNCTENGSCSPITGDCICKDGWQGESCQTTISTTLSTTTMREPLTILKTTQTSPAVTKTTIFTTTTTTTVAPSTTTSTSRPLTTLVKTPRTEVTTSKNSSPDKEITTFKPIVTTSSTIVYNNVTMTPITTKSIFNSVYEDTTKRYLNVNFAYNRTEFSTEFTKSYITTEPGIPIRRTPKVSNNTVLSTTSTTRMFPVATQKAHSIFTVKESIPITETTRKPETTLKFLPTTLKFKPKEIWIKPAQKGEPPLIDIKTMQAHESHSKPKSSTNKELAIENTTPKTIIVSIIPTSVSYATFKKMALTTASFIPQKNPPVMRIYNQSSEGITKSMSVPTSTSTSSTLKLNTLSLKQLFSTTTNPSFSQSVTNLTQSTSPRGNYSNKAIPILVYNKTNSMTSTSMVVRLNSSSSLTTTSSTNVTPATLKHDILHKKAVSYDISNRLNTTLESLHTTERMTKKKYFPSKQFVAHQRNLTAKTDAKETEISSKRNELIESGYGKTNITKQNATINSKSNNVTVRPDEDEEIFHILTEPEHITAVMGEKGTERTSVDLVSVISIAGGIMMAVITVAVIIVMIERCKRPRYEDVRKINDIRMQVMIDNNDRLHDVPPPYVRSIFHTPLPEPPSSEKCHYQPISTLDRNLKQFMRPVVVQTISPIMLENFRGILECHYDHLPRRSQDFGTMPARFNTAPSVNRTELRNTRALSVTESTIEALKCEAKLDVIDTTTAEPLYAEIPCWRPPSEHAIEIINMNGEAVTEL